MWAASKAAGDSADETADFTATSGTESFTSGDPSQTFTVDIVGDDDS